MSDNKKSLRIMSASPWRWVPSLYLYQGIPYSIVAVTTGLIYQNMGISAASFTFWTSLLGLPWTLKPLWSPVVDVVWTKRRWVLTMQMAAAAAFVLTGLAFTTPSFYPLSLAMLAVVALCSASHDIACDGFYMQALDAHGQTFFVGIRSTFYRVAMIAAMGLVPQLAGWIQGLTPNVATSWAVSLGALGCVLMLLGAWNAVAMPRVDAEADTPQTMRLGVYAEVARSFVSKPGMAAALLFFLLFRLGEAQLSKIVTPFLVADRTSGGIGMTPSQYGLIYGTIGMLCLTLGGVAGGLVAARHGLRRVIWPMALAMNVPNVVFVLLAHFHPTADSWAVTAAVAAEQLGYGFGFTAYMLYMLHYVGNSKFKTAEYAIGTTIMALGMMLPGMISGAACEWLGYENFFVYVLLCCIPGMLVIPFLKIDPDYGKKTA